MRLQLANPCDILVVTNDDSVVPLGITPMIDRWRGRVCAMLQVTSLYSVRRGVRLDLAGHITLFYINNPACVTPAYRDHWMAYIQGWLLRMRVGWERNGAARLLVDAQESSARYGILDILVGSPLRELLHQLVANSTRHWRCWVMQRQRLHFSFHIPIPAIAENAIFGLASCPELQLNPPRPHPSSPLPGWLLSNLNAGGLMVVCTFCSSRRTLREMLQCGSCCRLVCYSTCSKIVPVHVPHSPYRIGRQCCRRCAANDSDFDGML